MNGEYMDFLVEIGDPEFTAVHAEVQANGDKRFADYDTVIDWDNLTDEQGAIITDRTISHKERMAKLIVIRDRTASIHARGLGIKLD